MKNNTKTGVILMTYGSATTAEHVGSYFYSIYKDKASPELIQDFENRYRRVGGSPLIAITKEQARLLEEQLGENYVVRAGMRHGEPSIASAVHECKEQGASNIIGIILSPQFSSFIMEGYKTALTQACEQYGFRDADLHIVGEWSTETHFIQLLAERTAQALAMLKKKHGANTPVVFTTHSLPKRVVQKDPAYLGQIDKTVKATIAEMGDPLLEWYAGYQSAGHTPEEWLKPDLTDILKDLAAKKHQSVLIVPVQFLSNHLEILYDLDIAAQEQCDEAGIEYNRIELANTDALFITALASLVHGV